MSNHLPMPLDTDAFLADTTHLGTTEVGAYMLIIMAMWRSPDGYLVGDDRYLARATRLTMDKWRRIAPSIRSLLRADGARVTQKRIQKELRLRAEAEIPAWNPRQDSGIDHKPLKNKDPDSKSGQNGENASSLILDSETESQKKERKKTRVGIVLPDDWKPRDEERLYGRTVLHLSDEQIDRCAEKMRRWAITNAHRPVARKSNWDLTFRNWLDSFAAENGGSNENPGQRGDRSRGGFSSLAARRAREAFGGG